MNLLTQNWDKIVNAAISAIISGIISGIVGFYSGIMYLRDSIGNARTEMHDNVGDIKSQISALSERLNGAVLPKFSEISSLNDKLESLETRVAVVETVYKIKFESDAMLQSQTNTPPRSRK